MPRTHGCLFRNAPTFPSVCMNRPARGSGWGPRFIPSLVLLLGATSLTGVAQPPPPAVREDDQRYGIRPNLRLYPQDTPKAVLQSLLTAVEKKQYAYIVAHLLDPTTVDARLAERHILFLDRAEKELRQEQLRRGSSGVPSQQRLPSDPEDWKDLVRQRAREHAFRELVQQVQQRLEAEPHILRSFTKILTAGQFAETASGVKATHPEILEGALYFRQVGPRWFIENRREELPSPPAGSKPASSKDKD